MDLNEFMTEEESTEESSSDTKTDTASQETKADTAAGGYEVIAVPEGIDFAMNAEFKKMLYDDISMKNIKGSMHIKNQAVKLDGLNMDILDGHVVVNGTYDTKNKNKPKVDFDYDISDMDIQKTAETFNTVEKMAPIAKKCRGNYSSKMSFRTPLNSNMKPITDSMKGEGSVSTKSVKIKGFKPLTKVAEKLKLGDLSEKSINDVKFEFYIKDGKLHVKPFDVKAYGTETTVQGNTSINREIDYTMDMKIPRKKLGGKANKLISSATGALKDKGIDAGVGKNINVKTLVQGTVSDPKIKLNFMGSEGKSAKEAVKEKVKKEVKEKVEEKKKEVKKKAIEEAKKKGDKLVKEAKKKAERIRKEADNSADKVVEEAKKKGQKLVDEAGNPIAKAAAKKSKEKMVDKAKDKAEKIRKEGDKKADKVVEEAKEKRKKMIEKAKKKADQ
ncbi:MAG: AsmA-like C-terminal region-containing protein [Flavobacteriales bacterium]